MKKIYSVISILISIVLVASNALALTVDSDGLLMELPDSFISMGEMEGINTYLDLSQSVLIGIMAVDANSFSMEDSIAELISGQTGQTVGKLETRYIDDGTSYIYFEDKEDASGAELIGAIFRSASKTYTVFLGSPDPLDNSEKDFFASILDTVTTVEYTPTVAPEHTIQVSYVRTPRPAITREPTPEPAPEMIYPTLQKGDKGDEVKQLQQRLIELDYLSGGADGDYGNKTKEAVELFQTTVKLQITGIADHETQKALYSDRAPKAKVYKSLNYKELSRNPDQHKGEYYSFSGQVVQAMESSNWNGTISVTLRIATKSRYDDVVMVTYTRQEQDSRILEDDKVTVKGEYMGIQSYTAIMGNTVSVPLFEAELVVLR